MMKTLIYILLMLLTVQGLDAQEDEIQQPENYTGIWEEGMQPKFNFGAGLFIPQGNLSDFIGVSPLIDLELHIPAHRNHAFDIVVQFVIPNQTEDFLIQSNTGSVEASSSFLANYFLRLNKNLLPVESKQRFEIGIGVGASTVVTNVRNPFFEGEDDREEYENITTILITPGFKWKFRPSQDTLLTLGLDLHYAPYRIEGALEENIGGLALIPRILYSF